MRLLLLVLSVFSLSACESGKPVGDGETVADTGCEPANAAPYALITSHTDGDVVPSGETEVFTGIVSRRHFMGLPNGNLDSSRFPGKSSWSGARCVGSNRESDTRHVVVVWHE